MKPPTDDRENCQELSELFTRSNRFQFISHCHRDGKHTRTSVVLGPRRRTFPTTAVRVRALCSDGYRQPSLIVDRTSSLAFACDTRKRHSMALIPQCENLRKRRCKTWSSPNEWSYESEAVGALRSGPDVRSRYQTRHAPWWTTTRPFGSCGGPHGGNGASGAGSNQMRSP